MYISHQKNHPDTEFPSLDMFLQMRKNKHVVTNYFYSHLLPCVSGWPEWKMKSASEPIYKFVPVNTEVYAYLLVECLYDHVINGGIYKWNRGTRQINAKESWEFQAIDRYKELYPLVEADRAAHTLVDEQYLQESQKDRGSTTSIDSKGKQVDALSIHSFPSDL